MKIKPDDFRARDGAAIDLKKWPTKIKPVYESKEHYQELLQLHVARLSDMQQILYAAHDHALLVIFQAMDAAGKDSVIRHVMSGINPQGCRVSSFKHPSGNELDHDFLWRAVARLPERGDIGIFNRSYYEEVLIVRVHQDLLTAEHVPNGLGKSKDKIWENRHRSIRHLEEHLHRNGTRIIKFFLHLSKDEQRRRFLSRIDEPHKNWKFSMADMEERKYWKQYMHAYEACIGATSTGDAPWYIVPADDKQNARLIVSQIMLTHMQSLKLDYPQVTSARRRELQAIRRKLVQDR